MGVCCSKDSLPKFVKEGASAKFTDITLSEPLLLRLVSAHNLPWMDYDSESDVYVIAKILPQSSESSKEEAIATARWPVKWDSTDPLWDSCRLFNGTPPKATDRLALTFFDHDTTNSDDLIGEASCSIGKLQTLGERVRLDIQLGKRASRRSSVEEAPYCIVARESPSAAPSQKVMYVVRHGESVWNKAQKDKDAVAMLSDVDHPLNEAGRQQAEALRDSIVAAAESGASPDATSLLTAQEIMCSPLTRAVQTCLIGMEPVLLQRGAEPRHVLLNPNLREKRNFGGKDSSGKWCGEALSSGVAAEMLKLYEDTPDKAVALNAVPLNLCQVQNKWWLGSKESKAHVHERLVEMLAQVRFSPAESIVLVGHSHYFRELFRVALADSCAVVDSAGATISQAELEKKKLSNGGIARIELDFSSSAETPIVATRLLFSTELV
jgi:broad specificity phosphatase PhoE